MTEWGRNLVARSPKNRKVTTNKHIPPIPMWEMKLEQLSMERTPVAAERITWTWSESGSPLSKVQNKNKDDLTQSCISVLHSPLDLLGFQWGGLSITILNPWSLRF